MQTARTASFPAPIGGLNARDPLAAMKPTDAVILENWWPGPSSVEVRKGWTQWSTGYVNPVQTLMRYAPTSGAYKLFAAAGGSIFDATALGPVGAAVVTGLSSAQWQHTNIITPGGSFLWMVNGADTAQMYNGAAWSVPAVTGVSTNNIINLNVFGNRLFMVEKNTLKVWYLPVQSIAGAATAFDLSTIFGRGGYLMAMGTWSVDAGNGMNDLAVFVSSEGEVAIYQGADPASWTKQGVYLVGRPIGRKCLTKVAGDCLLLCEDGLYPLSRALQSSTIDRSIAVTDKIQKLIADATTTYSANYGWQTTLFPDANQLWINVPSNNLNNYQFVQNTISGSWTKFTNMNAMCWEVTGQSIFFGTTNAVCKAWNGQFDNTAQIQADALCAYQNFRAQAATKFFTMVRPSLTADGNPSILYGLDLDFLDRPADGALSYIPPTASMVWGTMVWGSMIWGGSLQQIGSWETVGGTGYYAALRLTVQANGSQVIWNATDYVYQVGGVL
ncbi:hypothetical protein J2W35_004954 [Variovorax boronicumulans]|uniref:hypothetical protein n=1 Tax=Variovorax boronicumulans TaxID=436515 RepID=UPI00278A25CC|nr:hypothetical protein [Variovorax boronicumulans]MDQ0084585.1 hypothetical protein [Variovorax boronicumulans]